ncbi:hypothetical protein [Phaeobacter inhibens]|uniref:RipA family octameric membrane protein n=1 Tax=Phaeobacter inhibens TaxID=221822 RepID=UPI0012E37C74|nr:hypothetical protein [Phaeobacter inhibens]WHP67313.1 hypothetical protein QMZ01_12260 [Phaeobacter inhibens]
MNEDITSNPSKIEGAFSEPAENIDTETYTEIYATVASLWDSECDRYWARNNIFLILQGALLAGFTSSSTEDFLRLSMACLGVLLCFIWFGISVQGAHYVARWRPALEEIERNLPVKPLHLVKSDPEQFKKKGGGITSFLSSPILAIRRGGSTSFMHFAILIIGVSWVILAFISAKSPPPERPVIFDV